MSPKSTRLVAATGMSAGLLIAAAGGAMAVEGHGEANKALMQQWLSEWVPKCLEAAAQLQPIWSQPAEKPVTFAASLEAATEKFTHLLEDLGLDVPKELNQSVRTR